MSWTPISGAPHQYDNAAGAQADGYYIKFYQAGTTTAFNMATDKDGGTTLDKCELDSSGYPTTDGSTIFIPHVNQTYKIALYKDATDADADNTTNADWVIDDIPQPRLLSDTETVFETVADMVASTTLSVGDHVRTLGYYAVGDGGNNEYDVVAAGTGTDDSGSFIDLATHQAKCLFSGARYNVKQWGARGDGTTDDTTAIQNAIDYINTGEGGIIFFPDATYLITAALTLYNRITLDLCGGSIIKQDTDGVSIIDCTGETLYTSRFAILNGRLQYTNQQTAVGGSALTFANGSGAQNFKIENISITKAYHAFYVPDGQDVFLCELRNVTSLDSDNYAYSFGGGASVHTTVILENVWALQTNGAERSGSRGFEFQNIQELIADNIAVDGAQSLPVSIATCQGRIGALVLERCDRTASSGGVTSMIQVTNSKLDISYLHYTGNTVTLTGTTSIGMLYADSSEVSCTLLRDYNTALTIGSGTYYTIYTTNSAVVYNKSAESDGTSPAIANSDTSANTPALTRTWNGVHKLIELDGVYVGTKTTAPSTTSYPEFSIVFHSDPALGEPLGWRRIGTDWVPIDAMESVTSTNLNDISHAVNTTAKFAGKQVWNTTTNIPAWASDSAAADTWTDAAGTTFTPV